MCAKCSAKQLLTVSGSVVIFPSISKAGGRLGTNFPEIFQIFSHIINKGVLELILDTSFCFFNGPSQHCPVSFIGNRVFIISVPMKMSQ